MTTSASRDGDSRYRSLVLVGVWMVLLACADKSIRPIGETRYEPLSLTAEVRVFHSEKEIEEPFTIVGIVRETTVGKFGQATEKDAIPGLQEKARTIGADGIILEASGVATKGLVGVGVTVAARAIRFSVGPTPPEP